MMSLILLLLLQTATPTEPGTREDADRLFEVGVSLVAEGDSAGAVAAWQGALATGWTSAAAEHNLGTVALARGDVGAARLHLERAARLDPFSDETALVLATVRERVGEETPSSMARAWSQAVAIVTPLGFVALALALSFATLAALVSGRRRVAGGVGAVAAVAVVMAVFAVGQATAAQGVVMAEAVATAAPGGSEAVMRLTPGEAVRMGKTADGWRSVRIGRARGWVPDGAVARL